MGLRETPLLRKGDNMKKQKEELVLIGWISDGLEPWYATKADIEKWKKET